MKDPGFLARYGVKVNVPLAPQTGIKAGGSADFYAEASNQRTLVALLGDAAENDLRSVVIGCGSRLVCADHGFRGLVVRYRAKEFRLSNGDVEVDAGIPVDELVKRLSEEERGGFEPFAGYPGSVGGAIAENAARGKLRLVDRLVSVSLFSGGRTIEVTPKDLRPGRLEPGTEWVIGAKLSVVRRDHSESTRRVAEAISERLRGEPAGLPFVFVFRDPSGERARDLLAKVKMGGERDGPAVVSEKNPNAIINEGGATATQVYHLAQRMKARVKLQLGIKLTESVVWLGEH